jgi:hypothetical protein
MHHPNGDMFDGTIVYGVSNGYGDYYFSNGRIYKGNFLSNDEIGGEGKMTYPNGMVYTGSWKNSAFNGFGKL